MRQALVAIDDEQRSGSLHKSVLDDQALVTAGLAGDSAQVETLVAHPSERTYGFAWRLRGNREEVEDMTQEVFLCAYARLRTFRHSASFATWLYRLRVVAAC